MLTHRPRRGFTLIEVLVTIVVASLAIAAVMAGFLAFNRMYYSQEGVRASQASIRQSTFVVQHHLKMAGYGIEPWFAFDFPAGWNNDATRNSSDTLVFRYRDPMFSRTLALNGASSSTLTLAAPLGTTLRAGQIVQVICPGASEWGYGVVQSEVNPGDSAIPLAAATGAFPRNNAVFDDPCFDGAPGLPVHLFKIDTYAFTIDLVDDDGDPTSPPLPFLVRVLATGREPIADNIEAMQVTFARADGSTFVPDPAAPAPDYDTPANDPRRTNNHPANIRAVRLGFVARSPQRDQGSASVGMLNTLQPFGDMAGAVTVPAGYRRILVETSVAVRNMAAREMFVPPYTEDSSPTACKGTYPADRAICAGG